MMTVVAILKRRKVFVVVVVIYLCEFISLIAFVLLRRRLWLYSQAGNLILPDNWLKYELLILNNTPRNGQLLLRAACGLFTDLSKCYRIERYPKQDKLFIPKLSLTWSNQLWVWLKNQKKFLWIKIIFVFLIFGTFHVFIYITHP